eukprot:1741134-Rhodomonas_salina.1
MSVYPLCFCSELCLASPVLYHLLLAQSFTQSIDQFDEVFSVQIMGKYGSASLYYRICDVFAVGSAICIRACYAVSGTGIAYDATPLISLY